MKTELILPDAQLKKLIIALKAGRVYLWDQNKTVAIVLDKNRFAIVEQIKDKKPTYL